GRRPAPDLPRQGRCARCGQARGDAAQRGAGGRAHRLHLPRRLAAGLTGAGCAGHSGPRAGRCDRRGRRKLWRVLFARRGAAMSRYPRLAAAGLAAAVIALAACTRPAPGHSASEAPQDLPTAVEASALAHPFAIGTLEAFVLHDGDITVPNDGSVLPRGEGDDSIDALLAANGLPTDVLRLSVQALLVRAHGRVILFDTGAGDAAFADAGRLGQALRVAGVEPGQVTDIFVSHAHPDHVGGLLDADGGLAFPDATVRMSAPEWAALQADEGRSALAAAIAPRVETFEPGAAAIVPGVDAVPVDG